MKTVTILVIALSLSACNKAADVPMKPAAANDMASKNMRFAAKIGAGSGKITEQDKTGGKITIAHGAIPAFGWPAMTMEFKADPKMLETATVGDRVNFELSLMGKDATVTAITEK